MAPAQNESSTKPGTACLCCRRRKLKCSREPSGCNNCVRAELPCIYPTISSATKRKRGPYKKKDKPARKAHLEHVVRYLSDPLATGAHDETPTRDGDASRHERSESPPQRPFDKENRALDRLAAQEPDRAPEDLVKDALIALTGNTVTEQTMAEIDSRAQEDTLFIGANNTFQHPPPGHLMNLWHLFVTRVDPVTKIIHCPSFSARMSSLLVDAPISFSTLAISVYFAAVSSCNTGESELMFGRSKASALKEYRQVLDERLVRHNHNMPDLESIQALVLYLICLCREDISAEVWALYSLTVRSAQLLALHLEPSTTCTPYEAEIRRRLWWTISSLESRCSEEGAQKSRCLLNDMNVNLPANLDDRDFARASRELPVSRIGITSMSFVLVRWEIMRCNANLWTMAKEESSRHDEQRLKHRMQAEYDRLGKHIEKTYLQYCDYSRPYDWLILNTTNVMMVKCCLTVKNPRNKLMDDDLSKEQRLDILQSSVLIIRLGYRLLSNPKCPEYLWFFRSHLQWHSLAIVIAEISQSTDTHFVQTAWGVLKPFINVWDRVYKNNTADATWNHVNMLINKAKASVKGHNKIEFEPNTSCNGRMLPFGAFDMQQEQRSIDIHPEERTSAPDMGFDEKDYDIGILDPFYVDFDALNTVFSSSDWEDALNMQIA